MRYPGNRIKKQNTFGAYKKLETYKTTWNINGVDGRGYGYNYTRDRFVRPIKKAYKISIHKSYRKDGKVKKRQWVIGTMDYYNITDNEGMQFLNKLKEQWNI